MKNILKLTFILSIISLSSCKKCKYCTEYTTGTRGETKEYCGEQLKYVDGDYSEIYKTGFKCEEN